MCYMYHVVILQFEYRDTKLAQRIVGGRNAAESEESWQVLLEDLISGNICGGSIINRLYVLTANHCNINDWMPPQKCKANDQKCKDKRKTMRRHPYPTNILGTL